MRPVKTTGRRADQGSGVTAAGGFGLTVTLLDEVGSLRSEVRLPERAGGRDGDALVPGGEGPGGAIAGCAAMAGWGVRAVCRIPMDGVGRVWANQDATDFSPTLSHTQASSTGNPSQCSHPSMHNKTTTSSLPDYQAHTQSSQWREHGAVLASCNMHPDKRV